MARQNITHAAALYPEPDPAPSSAPPEALVESYRRLAEVFHYVLSEQGLEGLLDRIADTLADLVPYDALHIYEADLAHRILVPVLARSDWQEEIMRTRPAFGQGITGWAVVERKPVLTNKAHLDPRVSFVPGTPAEPEALISVPLIARGSLKGALNIYRVGEEAAFDEDEFELAKWFGDAAALALDNAQMRARLEHQAQTDSLTGLNNHRFFHERLRAELSRASRHHDSVALLMFDIDDFKRVNDICGHAVGDQILVALAEMTQSMVRTSDIACRLGGEEFAVILPSCNAGDALGLARRLTERLEDRPIDVAGEITISIGIAQGPEHAMNPRQLAACAETAMMTAKARGKNRIVLFNEQTSERPTGHDPDRDIRSLAHLKMLQSLANKLNRLSDVREIGEAIVSELRMLIDYHNCRVYVVEGGECVPVAVRGDLGAPEDEVMERLRIRVGRGVTGQVAETGRPVLLPNAVESKHYLAIPGTDPIDESVIAVPLRYGSRVIGVVFLSQLGLNQFDENDLRLLEVLSGHASVALENARLYESLRREAANAKAWLEFADAMSSADSFEEIGEKTVRIVARQMEVEQCSLWLEDARAGIYYCAAAVGYAGDVEAEDLARRRVTKDAAEAVIGDEKTPFVVTADDVRERLFAGDERVRPRAGALAPLHQGYGVRGWIGVRAAPEHFSQSRLYLLEGLSFRASVAMQKALLYGNQQECAQVANAMLDFARALAEADELEEIYERIVERAAQILNLEEVSLWLQEVITGELRAVTVWDECDDSRAKLLAQGFTAEIGEAFVDAPEPFVLTPEEYEHIPAAPELGRGRRVAVAPFRFDGGRMGFLVGADADDGRFDELLLKMLAGLADQAKIAIANAR